ncbi:uncharacterized protein B0H18DRAFT_1045948, partial [Fomitopsis serialis]|uniref:uncharacterized protein n=1 Tax=Fomitopsis serialis TaxID=139415 RepID=UPI0020083AEB
MRLCSLGERAPGLSPSCSTPSTRPDWAFPDPSRASNDTLGASLGLVAVAYSAILSLAGVRCTGRLLRTGPPVCTGGRRWASEGEAEREEGLKPD